MRFKAWPRQEAPLKLVRHRCFGGGLCRPVTAFQSRLDTATADWLQRHGTALGDSIFSAVSYLGNQALRRDLSRDRDECRARQKVTRHDALKVVAAVGV